MMDVSDVSTVQKYSRICNDIKRVVVSFKNLSYCVDAQPQPQTCIMKMDNSKRLLLSSISGNMTPGLNAVMGPSGSGKSTLLNALTGRLKLEGDIYFDGSRKLHDARRNSGYVAQVDCLMGALTVRENMWYSANLRLAGGISKAEKTKKITDVISVLGLDECQNTKIGDGFGKSVSGGERKRTAIGVELILRPSVLFLDEPTSGLDASTAHTLMQLLKQLSAQGMNVIFSIHQPRFSIFKLFDTLTLLSRGKLVYHAPIQYTLQYFKSIGYECGFDDSPADFLQDVVSGEFDIDCGKIVAVDDVLSSEQHVLLVNQLALEFQSSTLHADLQNEIQRNIQLNIDNHTDDMNAPLKPNSLSILNALCGRSFKNLLHHPLALTSSAIINLFIGVLFGLFYFQVDNSALEGVQNRLGFIFFTCSNMLFGSFGAIEIFFKEKSMFQHEYQSGHYKVWHYFISKLIADLLPLRIICSILFCCVTYWMVGLKPEVGAFFVFVLTVFLLVCSATGIGIFYSILFDNFATSSIFVSLTFVFSVLFDGFLVNTATLLPWLRWLKYFSISR